MVHWDGMDSSNAGMRGGTVCLGCSHSIPFFPQYIGMGWTVGMQGRGLVQFGDVPTLSLVHWGT